MVNEKLIAFILKARKNKRSDDQITQQLLSVGWKQAAIGDALAEIKAKKLTSQPEPKQQSAPAQPQPPAQQPVAQPPQTQAPAQQPDSQAPQPVQPLQAQVPPVQPPPIQPAQSPQTTSLQTPTQPTIQNPQPAQQTAQPPPVKQIDLQQPEKKSFFSSIFGKKQPASQPEPQPVAQSPAQNTPSSHVQATPPPPAQAAATPPVPVAQPQVPKAATQATLPPAGQVVPPIVPTAQQHPSLPAPAQTPAAAPQQAKPAGGIKKFIPIIAIIVLLIATGAAYYFFVVVPTNNIAQQPTPEQPNANATPQNPVQKAAEPLDCGSSLGCLADASKECKPAKAISNTTADFLGMIVSSSSYLEIKSTEGGKCPLYVRTEDSSVKLGDATVVSALAKGVSMEEIRKQEAESTQQARLAVGMDGTCKFNTGDLTALLNRWKAGSYSSSDYAGADCSGKMFEEASKLLINASTVFPNTTAKANTTTAPKANTTKANTTTTPKANATTTPKANTTISAPKANATNATNDSSTIKAYSFSRKYTSYFPEHLDWFCTDRNMEFYRMHWQEYFGGGCNAEKPKGGYVGYDEYVATNCTILPCCINGPYNEYSRSYNYFECGYEEYVNNEGVEVKYINRITLPKNSS